MSDDAARHKRIVEEKVKLLCRELADCYEQRKVRIHVHINKDTNNVTISIELI